MILPPKAASANPGAGQGLRRKHRFERWFGVSTSLPVAARRALTLALGLLFSYFGDGQQTQAEPVEKLFADNPGTIEQRPNIHYPAATSAKRFRTSLLNTALFVGAGGRQDWVMSKVALNLFPDLEPTAVLFRKEDLGPERWVGYGFVEGERDSQFTLAVDQGVIAASVFIPGKGTYRIVSRPDAIATITEMDPDRLPGCGSEGFQPSLANGATARKSVSPLPSAALLTIPPASGPLTNLVTVVDLMVAYTPEARNGAGGTAAMNTLIDLAVAEANTVYQNSQANVRLRLVYRGETEYAEHPSLSTNLSRLQIKDDGFMDDIHALRETNRADVVCLILEHGESGVAGKAFTMTDPSFSFRSQAFSVVQRSEAVGTYIFAHEISHNFGCQHDRENALDPEGKIRPGAFLYSFGYRFLVDGITYRTVMAYAPGQPIPYLSNPNVLFKGVPAGLPGTTNGANNVLTVNNTAAVIGSFYGLPIQTAPPSISLVQPVSGLIMHSGTNLTLTVEAADNDGRVQQIEFYAENMLIGVVVNPQANTTNQLSSTNTTFSLTWTNVPAGEYRLTTRAVDTLGASSASVPASLTVRPFNDDFANRSPVSGSAPTVTGTTRAATSEPGEALHAGNSGGRSVWYSWVPTKAGTVVLAATGFGITPLPEVYKSVTANAVTTVTSAFEFDATNFVTRATFDVLAGETYSIALDALAGAPGDFAFSLEYQPPPPNDDFANRILLTGESISLSVTNVAATIEPGEPKHAANPGGKSVWYGWAAPKSGTVLVSVSATNFFPLTDIYLRTSATQIPTNPPPRFISFDQTNKTTTLSFDAVTGQDYAIAVDGLSGQSGLFAFFLQYPAAPPNDDFANRIAITGTRVKLPTSNLYATRQVGEPLHSGIKDEKSQGRKSIWYSWVAPVSGPVTVTCRGDGFYPLPDVYTGDSVSTLTNVPRRTLSFVPTNTISTLTFTAIAFRSYALAVDGFEGRSGAITVDLATEFSPPTAELFSTVNAPALNFKLRLFGSPGQNYVVQVSTNLVGWSDVFMGTFVTNSTSFTDENSAIFKYRFYRVLSVP